MDHRAIAGRFNAALGRRAGTLLLGGAPEPLYLPATRSRPALIRYTRDYPQSALHEVAHWCLATPARRRLVDYGLWYQPPPRAPGDQALFYAAEVPVQALEMLLARVCGLPFHFSADNPGADGGQARHLFEQQVRRRFEALCGEVGADAAAEDIARVLRALNPQWRRWLPAEPAAGRAGGAAADQARAG